MKKIGEIEALRRKGKRRVTADPRKTYKGMSKEEAEEEVERMKMRADLMKKEARSGLRQEPEKGQKERKYLDKTRKEAYGGSIDLADRINRVSHYRQKLGNEEE